MVEHNLAKVGVASSNLVSRSILFFILTFSLHAQNIHLKDEYCIKNPHVMLGDIVENVKNDKVLIDIPDTTSHFQVPTIKVLEKLEKLGFKVQKNEQGIIKFKRFCDFKLDALDKKLQKAVKTIYPNAYINSLQIKPKNTLPNGIDKMVLKNISVSKSSIKRQDGVFLAKFINQKGHIKSIYFSFSLDATLDVFVSTKDIKSGTILTQNHFAYQEFELKKLPINFLKTITPNTLIAKFNIKKGTILTQNAFKKKNLIKRGNYIKAILKDGMLSLEIEVKALNSGDRGDKIKVMSSDGKTFSAIIINKTTVHIR